MAFFISYKAFITLIVALRKIFSVYNKNKTQKYCTKTK